MLDLKIIIISLILIISFFSCSKNITRKEISYISFNEDYNIADNVLENYKKEALNGDIDSSVRLANYFIYYESYIDEGIKWLEQAAKAGDVNSQYNLAFIYANDKENYKLSKYWYLKATESGNLKAMIRLGEMYEHGIGVQKNLKFAKMYYEKAAFAGEIDSILKLIEFFNEGKDGKQDKKQTYIWLMVAETKISSKSIIGKEVVQLKKDLKALISPEDIKQAEEDFKIILNKIIENSQQ